MRLGAEETVWFDARSISSRKLDESATVTCEIIVIDDCISNRDFIGILSALKYLYSASPL